MFSAFMSGAEPQEIKNRAINEAINIVDILQQFPNIDFMRTMLVLVSAVQIAVNYKDPLKEEEETMIRQVFSEICDADTDVIMNLVREPLEEGEQILTLFSEISQPLAVAIGNFILCFARADGVCEPAVSEKVKSILSVSGNIFMGSPEDFINGTDA